MLQVSGVTHADSVAFISITREPGQKKAYLHLVLQLCDRLHCCFHNGQNTQEIALVVGTKATEARCRGTA